MLHKSFSPNLEKIEIEIITACNLRCFNCDRSSRQAVSGEFMSVSQVESFVNESIGLNWNWKVINILGGEPTLHPQFFEILEMIKKYKLFNPNSEITLATNGHGEIVKKRLLEVPSWI